MNRLALLFLLLITSTYLNANPIADSINFINQRIRLIENRNIKVEDSLKRELLFYKVKEDFFSEALSDQSDRFSLIVTCALAITAAVSIASFRYEVNRLKVEYENKIIDIKNEMTSYRKRHREHDIKMESTSGNIFAIAADNFSQKGQYILALDFYLSAARSHSLKAKMVIEDRGNKGQNDPYKYAVGNLESAKESLQKVILNPANKEPLREINEKLLSSIKIITQSENENLLDLCAECRTSIKQFLNS